MRKYMILLWILLLPVSEGWAQPWHAPSWVFGYRMGRMKADSSGPFWDNSYDQKIIASCSDGQDGAFVAFQSKYAGQFPGIPSGRGHYTGVYLARINTVGTILWVRNLERTGTFNGGGGLMLYTYQTPSLIPDGAGGVLAFGGCAKTTTFDGQTLLGGKLYQYVYGSRFGIIPTIVAFNSQGICTKVLQFGSGSPGLPQHIASDVTDSTFWYTVEYTHFDARADSLTPFPLPPDSTGKMFLKIKLPEGIIVKKVVLPMVTSDIRRGGNNTWIPRRIMCKKNSDLIIYSTGAGIFPIGDTTINIAILGKQFRAEIQDENLVYVDTLNSDWNSWIVSRIGSQFNSKTRHWQYLLKVHDSLAVNSYGVLRASANIPFRYDSRRDSYFILDMDSSGRWLSHQELPMDIGTWIGDRTSPTGKIEHLFAWNSYANAGPFILGPDILYGDDTQPYQQIMIWALDSSWRQINWSFVGGGALGGPSNDYDFRGVALGTDVMMLGTKAKPHNDPLMPARFAGYLQESEQYTVLLAGLRMPTGNRPVATQSLAGQTPALQAYPNPVSAGAEFRLLGRPSARLDLLDLTGRLLGTLPRDRGSYRMPAGTPPGLYLLRGEGEAVRVVVE